jgi:hypothetical protein
MGRRIGTRQVLRQAPCWRAADRGLTQEFTGNLTNRVAVIPWDGKDAFGRTIQGSVEATVSIGTCSTSRDAA